eukprot:1191255-Prorocentrum_minimum.AAC.6
MLAQEDYFNQIARKLKTLKDRHPGGGPGIPAQPAVQGAGTGVDVSYWGHKQALVETPRPDHTCLRLFTVRFEQLRAQETSRSMCWVTRFSSSTHLPPYTENAYAHPCLPWAGSYRVTELVRHTKNEDGLV